MKKTKDPYFSFDGDSSDEGAPPLKLDQVSYEYIYTLLDAYVVGQSDAKRALAFAGHLFSQPDEMKSSGLPAVLLLGPSGSGKTMLAKVFAEVLRVPFLIIDSTQLTNYGFRGTTIASHFCSFYDSLVMRYKTPEAALWYLEHSLIIFDEIDKLAGANVHQSLTSFKAGIQQELLMLFGTESVTYGFESENRAVTFDPRTMLFLFFGAFTGIEMASTLQPQAKRSAGFLSAPTDTGDTVRRETVHDTLIRYGLMRELVGRIGDIAVLQKLTAKEIKAILLNTRSSPLNFFKDLLQKSGKTLEIENDVFDDLAEKALIYNTGARAITYVLYQIFKKACSEAYDKNVIRITKAIVAKAILQKYIE